MSSLRITYSKRVEIDSSGAATVRMHWILKNVGGAEIAGLWRYTIISRIDSENLQGVVEGRGTQVTRRPTGTKTTTLVIAPLRNKLAPDKSHEMEVSYKSSDLVEHFTDSGLWVFEDNNKIDDLPAVPATNIDGKTYPAFSLHQEMEYECSVTVPKLKRTAWEKPVLDTWSLGTTGNPKRSKEKGKDQITYRFTVQPGNPKQFAVLYGNQPRSMPKLIAVGAVAILWADIAVAVFFAYGIVFQHVDETRGIGLIVALIGSGAFLKWLSATERFAKVKTKP